MGPVEGWIGTRSYGVSCGGGATPVDAVDRVRTVFAEGICLCSPSPELV